MKHRVYIDIKTTGLSMYYADLTVIGIGVEKRLGVKRKLQDIDDYVAVQLWWDYEWQ